MSRYGVREPSQLDLITRFLFDNCGNLTSAKRVANYISAQGLAVSVTRAQNYLELRARGYTVSVGKLHSLEVDFVAERADTRVYIQVCYLLAEPATVEREFGVLERLNDNHPKLVLSLDEVQPADRGGIQWRNLVDFLLDR